MFLHGPLVLGPATHSLFLLRGRQLTQWDLKEHRVMKTFAINTRRGGRVRFAFSPDAARVAAGVDGRPTFVWNTETGAQIELVDGKTNSLLHALAFSRDGATLASAAEDGKIRIWDPGAGKLVKTLQIGPSRGIIEQLAFSFDKRYLITVNGNGSIYVVDLVQRRG
jgi:WD40 repeat protein